jgi:hypothetical protein
VRNTRFHGTSTSSSHIWPSSSSKRLLSGARERVGVARGGAAADHRDARRIDRHDEGGALAVELGAVDRADIDVLGEGRAGVHADLAAHTTPASERPTILSATRSADCRAAGSRSAPRRREGEEAAGAAISAR